jgi:hypothetical protein
MINGKMGRQGIVRRTDRVGDHSCSDADRLVLDQESEYRKPRRLGQGRKRGDSVTVVELISRRDGAGVTCNRQHRFSHCSNPVIPKFWFFLADA